METSIIKPNFPPGMPPRMPPPFGMGPLLQQQPPPGFVVFVTSRVYHFKVKIHGLFLLAAQ